MIRWIALLLLATVANAIPIDNGVEGDPEIECGPTSITVNFNTQKAFEGHVYVKGLFDQAGCRNDEGGRQVAGISLPFDSCNVARTRSLNPKGVFVSTVVIISFHPKFETKVDRAYRIQCFYMEADKTVSQELEVSALTTGFQTQVVPMPVCRYEILAGGPTGAPVHFALVGDAVYHKWTCDTETVDTFCMVVHSCFVDDGNGDRVDLLTAEGCAVDRFLLNNLEYPTDLMAGQEAHVFKYADRTQLFFQCQITITIKEPAGTCPRPTCAVPEGFAAGGTIAAGGASGASAGGAAGSAAGGSAPAAASSDKEPASASAAQPAPAAAAATEASAAPAATEAATTAPAPAPAPAAAEAKPAEGGEDAAPAQLRVLKKRQAPEWERDNAGVMDVRALVKALDIDDRADEIPSELNQSSRQILGGYGQPVRMSRAQDGFCLSTATFTILLALAALLFAAVVVIASCLLRSNRKF